MDPTRALRTSLLLGLFLTFPALLAGQAPQFAAGPGGSGTALLERDARLHVEAVPLRDALVALAERSGVPLAYSPSLLPSGQTVTCACQDVTVREALERMLRPLSFRVQEGDGQVILVPPEQAGTVPVLQASTGTVVPTPQAEEGRDAPPRLEPAIVTGRVTAGDGSGIGGAIVRIPSLDLSTLTNDAGTFRLTVPEDQVAVRTETLVATRIGFQETEVTFELGPGTIRVDVRMSDQAIALSEIVVTGTAGNLERRAQSAVVASIDAASLTRGAAVRDVTQLLQARIPGLSMTQSSGTTGSAPRINIRGASSISLSNQPLVFIDGVRVEGGARGLVNVSGASTVGQAPSALNDLNPMDIESIEVVKGPAAATLYGADASAGVIQIITKRGRMGASTFTQELTVEYDHIDRNFTVPTNYAACIEALVGPSSPNPLCRGQEPGTVVSDNPAERIGAFRNGSAESIRYSARGGGESYGYFASFAVLNESGTTPNNSLEQRTGRVNFTFSPRSELTFDASLTLGHTEYDLPRTDQDAYGYYVQSILGSPLTVREGEHDGVEGGLLFAQSTLESLSSIVSRSSALRSNPSVQVHYSPTSWFTNRATLGADLIQGRGFQMFPRNDHNWYPSRLSIGNGDVSTTEQDDRRYTVDYLGNLSHSFGEDGRFGSNLSFGSQFIHRQNRSLSGSGGGLVTNTAILVGSTATSTVGQGYGESKALGLFVQEQLSYDNRIYVQVGLRADRNSAFGRDVGTFYLPKVGVSWVVSEEDFWVDRFTPVSTLRVRGAWGTTGRSPATAASLRTFSTSRYVTDAGVIELGVTPGNPGNPELQPERGTELEAGFDIGLFGDRVGGELTYFRKTSTDLLVNVPVSPSSGFGSSPWGNLGEVRNSGVEFELQGRPIDRPGLSWDLTLQGSTLHNEIVSLGTAGTFISNFRAFQPGQQVGAWWVHRIREVNVEEGLVVVSDTAEFAGNQLPTFQGTLASSLSLRRGLTLNALVETKRGYHVYNLNQEFRDRSAFASREIQLPQDQGGYSPEARLARLGPYRAESTGNPVGAGNVKDPYIQKGDHVRLQELSATWRLPENLVTRMGAETASLTVGGRNLGLWAPDFQGDDPDVLGTGPQASGLLQLFNVDVFTTPPSRRWIVRMNLQF